jgi:hypothetical protein
MPSRYDFKSAFEREFPGQKLTSKQLWLLTMFAKNVRLRCRNNSAFNNFMNQTFPYAKFRQVTKAGLDGKEYQGLSLVVEGEEFTPEMPDED